MTSEATIASVAGEAYNWFETRTRDDESSFETLKDGHPDWLGDLVRNAHGDFLPDDWRYQSIRRALGWIHDNEPDDLDDAANEFAEDNVDTYNAGAVAWLASNLTRSAYCDEALDEFGPETINASAGVFHLIRMGQYMESCEIWGYVVRSLVEYVERLAAQADPRGERDGY